MKGRKKIIYFDYPANNALIQGKLILERNVKKNLIMKKNVPITGILGQLCGMWADR